jgi:sugar phosphate isomerase/epimerase
MNKVSQTIPYQIDTGFSPFKASEFNLALDFLEERNFTGAELAIAYPAQVDAKALLKQLESHHLTATTISTGQIYGLEGLYLSSFDESVRTRAVKVIKEHVDLSVDIGLPPVTIGLVRG